MNTEIKKVILGLKQAKETDQNRNYRINQGIDFICEQKKEIKIRNEIIKEFCQNVDYETPQVNATFKKAINLMNLHLVQS